MMRFAIYVFCIYFAESVHHVTQNQISSVLNSRIRKPYTVDVQENLIKEDENFKEYQSPQGGGFSWIIRVSKKTNIVESWQFSNNAGSCQDGMSFAGQSMGLARWLG